MVDTSTRLDRWLAPRVASRVADTMRMIKDDPTTVAWFRGNVQQGSLDVRIVDAISSDFSTARGAASEQTQGRVTILAPPNTGFKRNDRLTAEGNVAWRIVSVAVDRSVRTEATAETA